MNLMCKKNNRGTLFIMLVACCELAGFSSRASAQGLLWKRQYGTVENDSATDIAVDSSNNIYVSGQTTGDYASEVFGNSDVILSKFNTEGLPIWSRQFGADGNDFSAGVVVDAVGDIFVAGTSYENGIGTSVTGLTDTFIRKYNTQGSLLWERGITESFEEQAYGVAIDSENNFYVMGYLDSGSTGGTFVYKYDTNGSILWDRVIERNVGFGVSTDPMGNLFIAGFVNGSQSSAFITKINSDGETAWLREFATDLTSLPSALASDSFGNLYVGYSTREDNRGDSELELWLSKYDSTGTHSWTTLLGTAENGFVNDVSIDEFNNILVGGGTNGNWHGHVHDGGISTDAFLLKYRPNGKFILSEIFGTTMGESVSGIAIDNDSRVFVAGSTYGKLGATHFGQGDVFLGRFFVPEPASLVLASMLVLAAIVRRRP